MLTLDTFYKGMKSGMALYNTQTYIEFTIKKRTNFFSSDL